MNSYQAKQLNLPDLMGRLGYEPTSIKKEGKELLAITVASINTAKRNQKRS